MVENFLKSEEDDLKNIFNRFRDRNFSGNTGQAIKNSILTRGNLISLGEFILARRT